MPYRVMLTLPLLAALTACDVAEPCDTNQRFERGVCVDEALSGGAGGSSGSSSGSDAGAATGTDAGADAGAEAGTLPDAGAACAQALDEALGVECIASPECGCAAPYCAVMPGQPVGYCTTSDCDPEGDDCPSGHTCFDLASLGVPGVPTFCVSQ